jgi:hypothetical protein
LNHNTRVHWVLSTRPIIPTGVPVVYHAQGAKQKDSVTK